MGDPVDLSTERIPGLLLLVSERKCGLCRAPLVYAEPTKGLLVYTQRGPAEFCLSPPCPMALRAKPVLDDLQRVLKALKAVRNS
jgi:hypothetical protein